MSGLQRDLHEKVVYDRGGAFLSESQVLVGGNKETTSPYVMVKCLKRGAFGPKTGGRLTERFSKAIQGLKDDIVQQAKGSIERCPVHHDHHKTCKGTED